MIKIKLWCRLFGHDFRHIRDENDGYRYITPAEHCRNCGLSKTELKERKE
jgi:hypothetical protein